MTTKNPRFYGLSQYRVPFVYELAGKNFHFILDDGREFSLNFLDGEIVMWAENGKAYVWDKYECLKGDETTYLVHIRPECFEGLVCYNFIIDTAQSLVTLVVMEEGTAEYERIMRATPYFGAIKVPGLELPAIRHHLSTRMVGKHIFWHYNTGFNLQHIYYSATAIRADSGVDEDGTPISPAKLYEKDLDNPDPEIREAAREKIEGIAKRAEYYPFYEEPCFHIWINEHLNLLCFAEEIMIRRDPEHTHGGGGILLLQDIERVIDVGLCYNKNEYVMVTAFGEENEDVDPLDTTPTPYDWSSLTSIPSIYWKIEEDK